MKRTASPAKVKKSGIRAINQGTRYDISGRLRSLAREIERGEYGKIGDVVIVFDKHNGINEYATVEMKHYGAGSDAVTHWLVSTAAQRSRPS